MTRTRRMDWSAPHTIEEADIASFVKREWIIAASSSREPKRLEVSLFGSFRVTHGDAATYEGQNISDAVRAYNEIK